MIGPAGTKVEVGVGVIVRVAVGGRDGVRVGVDDGDCVAVGAAARDGGGTEGVFVTVGLVRVDVAAGGL